MERNGRIARLPRPDSSRRVLRKRCIMGRRGWKTTEQREGGRWGWRQSRWIDGVVVLVSQALVARSRLPQFDAPRARSGHLCCRDRDNICFFISTRDPHSTYLAFPPPVAAPLLQSYRTSLAVLLQALEAASPLLRHSGRISYFRWGAALQWRQFRRAAATEERNHRR